MIVEKKRSAISWLLIKDEFNHHEERNRPINQDGGPRMYVVSHSRVLMMGDEAPSAAQSFRFVPEQASADWLKLSHERVCASSTQYEATPALLAYSIEANCFELSYKLSIFRRLRSLCQQR